VGDIDIVKLLIRSKADPNKWCDRSPLVIAADKGLVDIAILLIESGSDINTDPDIDYTPLMCAVELNSIQLVKKLIDSGADVNAWGNESNPPLSLAGCNACKEIYQYLLPLIDPNYHDDFIEEGIFISVSSESLAGLEFFVSMNANVNCNNELGETPLIFAAKYGYISSSEKLIQLGADRNLQDNESNTALSYAVKRNRSEIIKILT
jgi:uncharacterized protein